MKQALVFISAFVVALAVFGGDYTPVTEESASSITAAVTVATGGSVIASGTGYVAGTPQVSAATNVVSTSFTPQYAGQLLIGTVSNLVYVAEDTTTNGWVQLSN